MNSHPYNAKANDYNDPSNNIFLQIDSSKYNLKDAVKLPVGEQPKEWIANNLFDFHKQICMLYRTIQSYCTARTCPKMTAGKKYEYLWSNHSEPVELYASQYIHHMLDWVQEQLSDEDIFPSLSFRDYPPNFIDICRVIAKRLFRVYAHIYHHHLAEIKEDLKIEAHMNTSLKHFIYFVQEFNLVCVEDLEPLRDHIEILTRHTRPDI